MKLDVDFVRAQFPAFSHPRTREWAFFENAGGSYVCRQVIEKLDRFMTEYKVQPYGPFELSMDAGRAMDAGYAAIAGLSGTHIDSITLGPSTTMNAYVLAQSLRPALSLGDEIVVTNQDHEANIGAWRRLAESGIVIREWSVNPEGELDVRDLEMLVGSRTRLVCFTLASNIVATLNPVAEIAAIAHRHGALVVGDAVSFAPHAFPEFHASGLDFCLYSTYKTFATHVGVMWGSSEALERTTNQSHYFNDDKPHYRLNPAGPLHAEIGALEGLGEYVSALYAHHFDSAEESLALQAKAVGGLVREHEERLTKQLLEGLSSIGGFRVVGRGAGEVERRASTVSLVPTRIAASVIARKLGETKIAVRNGHFYAMRLIEALGIDPAEGVLRISLVHYNTEQEVGRLLEAVEDVVA